MQINGHVGPGDDAAVQPRRSRAGGVRWHPRKLFESRAKRRARRVKVSTSLRFLHEVLGLEHLHYGLWQGESLTLEGLKHAQRRYSERLLGWIPEGVASVLEVGAGVGTDAAELDRRGFEVEAVSPDPYQQDRFVARTGLPFHLARLQDLEPSRTYDLVLMSESAQYVWIETIFDKVRELAPGGYLLLADHFVIDPQAPRRGKGGHRLDEFRRRATVCGFDLVREEDVTEEVLPTLELGRAWIDSYFDPSVAIALDAFASRAPLLHRLGRSFLRRKVGDRAPFRRLLDPPEFLRTKRYLFMLYRAAP